MKETLWKLYLVGRKREYKLLGFIRAPADQLPKCVARHDNLCFDIVKDTSEDEAWKNWYQPWPKGVK